MDWKLIQSSDGTIYWLAPGQPLPDGYVVITTEQAGEGNFPEYVPPTPTPTPTPPPTPPPPTRNQEGDTGIADDGTPVVFRNGQWVPQGTAGGGTGGGGTGDTGNIEDLYGSRTAYLQSLGIGPGYQDPSQKYQARQYDKFRNIWELQSPINEALQQPALNWEEYLSSGAARGGKTGAYRQASDTLQNLLGMSLQDRNRFNFRFEPEYDDLGNPLTKDQTGRTYDISDLQKLINLSTRNRSNPIAASWLSGQVPGALQDYQLQQANASTEGSFLDYFSQLYNLRNL